MMDEYSPDNTPLSLAEQISLNFYQWERRGRGWQVWDYLVELEPPYKPFYHKLIQPLALAHDDGRKHTIVSGLIKKVKNNRTTPTNQPQLPYIPQNQEELLPVEYTSDTVLKEIQISLPTDSKFTFKTAEAFLLSLSYCTHQISFEIVGTPNSIYLQIACREADATQTKQQLQAYFPEAVIHEREDSLRELWNEHSETVIADFGLSQEFMRPLKTFQNLDTDPLIGIIGALENLERGELGMIQILFQPVHNPWAESILRSMTAEEGKPFFANNPEMLPLAREKVNKPLFVGVIRVISQSPETHRAWEIAKGLGSGLIQTANSHSNELIPLNNDDYEDVLHKDDVLYRQTHRSGMILNSSELVSLIHLPTLAIRSQKLLREVKKTKSLPGIATHHPFVLGENVHQGQTTKVTLSAEQRLRHVYIVGATGTGKSTLLLNLITQDIQNGLGVTVLDPHGDLIDRILGYIPEERYKDVVLLDPSDSEYPVGLNILSAHSEIEKNVLASDLVSVFKRLSTSWGDQMTSVLSNAILAILESTEGGTLVDLRRFLVETSYRNQFLQTVKDSEIVYYWHKEYPLLRGNPQSAVLTRLDTFLRPKLIRNMVAQKKGINFEDILNNQKILLCKLAQGLIGEENSYLLGSTLVSRIHQVAMARQALNPKERKNFFLYIDEFHNFITPSMSSILSGTRKYGLGLIIANQELKQIKDSEVMSSVISNPGTRVCFRLGDFDAQKLADGFSFFESKDLENLGVGEAICRIERSEYDFNLKVSQPVPIEPETASFKKEKILDLSRTTHAMKREEIEKNIALPKVETPVKEVPSSKPVPEKQLSVPLPSKEEFTDEHQKFLEVVHQNPDLFVTQLYDQLGLSGYKGDKLKTTLIDQGYLVQEDTRQGDKGRLAKVLNLTDKGLKLVGTTSLVGKGGNQHQEIQQMLKEQAQVFGWKAKIEERIPQSLESVDVGLTKDDLKVAIEISVTTPTEHEMKNIGKCLQVGYDYIICVSPEEQGIIALKKATRKFFRAKERLQIRFCLPDQVKNILKSLDSTGIVSERGIDSERIKPQKQLMDKDEAAEFLGIKVPTLYTWVNQRKIPFVKVGRLNKFRREDLEKWLQRHRKEESKEDF